jgi:hypothetical protein
MPDLQPVNLKHLRFKDTVWASGGFQITRDIIKGFIKKETGFDTFIQNCLGLLCSWFEFCQLLLRQCFLYFLFQ